MSQQNSNHPAESFAGDQIDRWRTFKAAIESHGRKFPIITVCTEPGSGGALVAEKVADTFGFDFFHRKLLEVMSITSHVDARILERLEKERLSGLEDVVSQMIDNKYLYPGIYMEHLEKVLGAISRRGHAVVVGRGANFLLPPEERLSVLVVAPREMRIQRVADQYGILPEDAEKRVQNRQKRRSAFVRKNFNKHISDPVHYDLALNTGILAIEDAVRLVCATWFARFYGKPSE